MYCLSKRSNGFFYVYYASSSGKRTCISTKTKYKAEAIKFLSAFKDEVKKRNESKIDSIFLNDFIAEFINYSNTIHTTKTDKAYNQSLSFLKKYFGNILINRISNGQMIKYFENRINESSIYQARKDLICFSSCFNYAIKQNYIMNNPCKGIKRFKIPEKQPLFFSESEFQTLLRFIDNEVIKDMVIISAHTGLRQMELLTLRWSQIDFKEKALILDNQFSITKSKRVRAIPLNLTALQIFTKLEINKGNNDLIFSWNGYLFKQNFIGSIFKGYVLKAGLNPKLHWHSLRHTCASWLIQKGVPIFNVQHILGHADIKTTSIYAHIRNEDLSEALSRISNNN